MTDGPYRGRLGIDENAFHEMLGDFYEELGWDRDSGYPTDETIDRLGLTEQVGISKDAILLSSG